jgi:hypothetical protein
MSTPLPAGGPRSPLCLLFLLLLLTSGCGEEPVVLEVGSIGFTQDQIRGLSDARLEELTLIAVLAEARLADEEATLPAPALARVARESRIRGLREEITLDAAGVTEEDLEARYQASPEEELEVRHLVVISERWRPDSHRSDAEARAREALQRIEGGEDFAQVAGEVSEEPGAERRGGLLDPGREGTWVPEFWEAAHALEEGGTSDVVETEFGFHVLRLESRTLLPFEEARPRVVREVASQLGGTEAWEAWRDDAHARVELHTDAMADFRLDDPMAYAPDPAPPSPEELDRTLASWPEGALTAGDLVRALQGHPRARWRAFQRAEGVEREEALHRMALDHHLEAIALERGIDAAERELAQAEREWEGRLVSWTAFLGIPEAPSRTEAPEQVLEALRSTDQNARVARSEMAEWSPLLLAAYPVRLP